MINILALEDSPPLQSFLKTLLAASGYQVSVSAKGLDGFALLSEQQFDLVLLDLGLQDMDGQDWLLELRQWSQLPVLVLSARDGEVEKVTALDNGANDYLTKPFSANELLARIRVLLRTNTQTSAALSCGSISIDPHKHLVMVAQQEVKLTKKEYAILLLMLQNKDKVLTHNAILSQVWGEQYINRPEYIRVHMAQLRQKLEANPASPKHLLTEPAVGYRLVD
ncbi:MULTISPECIES: response regulator [Pseudoalteromonas]|uniref:Response regulator transcription factor n=1 Tax=Pseudoalteromonas haloplanktis TaxID=228 RepID=A0ABU1B6U9_PSEHA|nr:MULTISPECIES: response regulator transcription factor [Pseudoalteromonas]MCF6146335.1 two-component system, OmpR family, KDP operon response regulator KdpE [Pseudoalteromonas mariniglutinosa NCIMB 1770]MDQ9090285.1 response regulator transcription factor [Pseudoalteromonas haloplanktis]TMN71694.1 DNA-binding response regulator [Pseudoalteromonas sp. S1727]